MILVEIEIISLEAHHQLSQEKNENKLKKSVEKYFKIVHRMMLRANVKKKKKISLIMKSAWMTLFLFLSLFESVWELNKCVYYREQRKVFRSCFDWSKLRKKARKSLRFNVMLLWQFKLCYVLASYSHMIDLKICKKTQTRWRLS